MRNTELIAQDRMVLRRGLEILDRMVQIMEAGERIEIFDIRTVLGFLRLIDDHLLLEHGEQRELVSAIEDALNSKHGPGFVRNSRQLILLLRNPLNLEASATHLTPNAIQSEPWLTFARLERKYAPRTSGIAIDLDRRAHA